LKAGGTGKGGVHKELRAYRDEMKINVTQKQAIYAKVDAIKEEINELASRLDKSRKKID
jgi:hypothetical protein